MDVKRYDLGKDQEHVCDCDMMDWPDGEYVLYEDIEKHYIPRPDPAEVERLIEFIIQLSGSMVWFNVKLMKKDYDLTKAELDKARADLLKLVGGWVMANENEDICGLCGEPGADKYKHPVHWPGEQNPESKLVHSWCEEEECRRAHALLSDEQRRTFLRRI